MKFINHINWKQIFLHSLAAWFIMYGFYILSFLHNLNHLYNYKEMTKSDTYSNEFMSKMLHFTIVIKIAPLVGLLLAFIISIVISLRKKWYWVNSAIMFVAMFLLNKFNILGWEYAKYVLLQPGWLSDNRIAEFILNGTILLSLGLFIFFWKGTNHFIEAGFGSKKPTAPSL